MRLSSITTTPRVEIARILCAALDDAKLPWAITHGAEGFPECVGRDFDILLPARFHAQAVSLIQQESGRQGWSSCLVPLRWAGAPVFLWKLEGDALHSFEMHFIDRIDWAGCILADGSEAGLQSQRQNGLSLAVWPAFAKRVLTQILAGCWDRIEERPGDIKITLNEAPHLPAHMSRLFGRKAGLELLKLIEDGELAAIRRNASSYRLRLIFRTFLPGSGVRLSLRWFSGKFARTFGIAPWRPPNLVMIVPNEPDFEESTMLAGIIGHLGFAKCKVISATPPGSLTQRLRERWEIHIHRSLFRLVGVQFESKDETASAVIRRLGFNAFNSGTFIATLSPTPQVEVTCAHHFRQTITEYKDQLPFNRIAAVIALRYLESMKTMQLEAYPNNTNDQP